VGNGSHHPPLPSSTSSRGPRTPTGRRLRRSRPRLRATGSRGRTSSRGLWAAEKPACVIRTAIGLVFLFSTPAKKPAENPPLAATGLGPSPLCRGSERASLPRSVGGTPTRRFAMAPLYERVTSREAVDGRFARFSTMGSNRRQPGDPHVFSPQNAEPEASACRPGIGRCQSNARPEPHSRITRLGPGRAIAPGLFRAWTERWPRAQNLLVGGPLTFVRVSRPADRSTNITLGRPAPNFADSLPTELLDLSVAALRLARHGSRRVALRTPGPTCFISPSGQATGQLRLALAPARPLAGTLFRCLLSPSIRLQRSKQPPSGNMETEREGACRASTGGPRGS